jgi:hypothetical protein
MSRFTLWPSGLLAAALLLAAPLASATSVVTDTAGDSSVNDILSASGGFDDASLFLDVAFQPGSVDFGDAVLQFDLDTDLDLATGTAFSPRGADFVVFYNSELSTTQFFVAKVGADVVGQVPARFGGDSLGVSVPLALLDGDDGVARFGAQSGIPAPIPGNPRLFVRSDFVPDQEGSYALGGVSTRGTDPAIPEPGGAALFALGCLLVGRRLRRSGA